MFSDFEIAKPKRNFSQLHLEFNEVHLCQVETRLLLETYA